MSCPNGHGLRNLLPGGALDDRSLAAARSLFDRVTREQVDTALGGDCPLCYARTERTVFDRDVDPTPPDGERLGSTEGGWRVEAVCGRCGALVSVPVELGLDGHPVVRALLTAAGHDPRQRHVWGGDDPVSYDVTASSLPLTVRLTVGEARATFSIDDDWSVTVESTPDWLEWPRSD